MDTVSEDKLDPPRTRKRVLKSGKILTADTLISKKITWPHEVVYNRQGQPVVYNDMGIAQFVNGYLTVLGEESDEVKVFMLIHLQG